MEKGQSEVTSKIRSAIKQKLAEMSDFVDDELPEYIMILVANQRSKSQIEKDLSLFLRKDTVKFTNWLWDLLNNLKIESKSEQAAVPKIDSDASRKELETDEDAVVLDFDPDEREIDFFCHEDTNDSLLSKSSSSQPPTCQISDVKKELFESKPTQNKKPVDKSKSKLISPIKMQKKSQGGKDSVSSAVIPVKRKFTDSGDEYDPSKPEYEQTSSKSKIRKYNGPAALQANKLLLKAVDDATKSILAGKSIDDYYKPTPIKVLASKIDYNTMPSNVKNKLQAKNFPLKLAHKTEPAVEDHSVPVELDCSGFPPDVIMEDDLDYPVSLHKNRTIHLNPSLSLSDSVEFDDSEFIPESNSQYSFQTIEQVRPRSPHFIVTLDGVSRATFKNKFGENSIDSMDEDEEEDETDSTNELLMNKIIAAPEKKPKLNERCKYWPACKNSENCPYHHPTIPCKCFPDCKFGDKCLYIHPNCKFDALCSRKDCPYTHASKRKLPLIAIPMKMIPIKSRRMKVVCKFYPKCSSRNCPFIHPKLCRYGTECRLPSCLYGHFPVPSRSQLKWQAAI